MNEEIPPLPRDGSNPQPSSPLPPRPAPNFWAMFGLGFLLLILSWVLCAFSGRLTPFGISLLIAFATAFFKRYRGVAIGFLAAIGLALLLAAIWCGIILANPQRPFHPYH